ncbi:MAG: LapA family protein [Planctomycetes bacterium]|jgi:uncharacterized integral membrane protein|nr:LapA family protein [Planctomycetota bacterium]
MRKVKLTVIIVISVLALIILLQNTEPVEASILFVTVPMSRALLMMLMFVLGFVAGILVPTYLLRKAGDKTKSGAGSGR